MSAIAVRSGFVSWPRPGSSIIWTRVAFEIDPERATSSILEDVVLKQWIDREKALLAIRRYRDDWDGLGAKAPDPVLIDAAVSFLRRLRVQGQLPPPSAVSATPQGRVTMEWQFSDRYVEAELVTPQKVEWMMESGAEARDWSEPLGNADTLDAKSKDQMWSANTPTSTAHAEPAFAY